MTIAYGVLFVVTLGIGLIADVWGFQTIHWFNSDPHYNLIIDELRTSGIENSSRQAIIRRLNILRSMLDSTNIAVSSITHVTFYFVLVLVLYGAYRAVVVRGITLDEVVAELRTYYSARLFEDEPPSGGGSTLLMLFALVVIARPFMSMIAGLVTLAVYLATVSMLLVPNMILLFLTVFLTSAYGFVLNDYVDIEKDKINHPQRVLPKGLLLPSTALRFAIATGVFSLLFSANFSLNVFLLNVLTLFLLSIYSFINNRNGILANVITATNSAFVLVIGMLAGQYNGLILWLSLATFLLILGREVILDIRDIVSDRAISKSSIPIHFGIKKSIIIASFSFLLSSVITILSSMFFEGMWPKILVSGGFNIILWVSFVYYMIFQNERSLNTFLLSTRLAFLLFPLAIILQRQLPF